MSVNLNNAAVTMFDPMVKQAYQAAGFKLRGTMRTRTDVIGKTVTFPKMGLGIAHQKAPQDDVVLVNADYSQVSGTMEDWHASELSDIFAQKEVNFDEMRELAEMLGKAIGRRSDQLAIDALSGSGTTNTIAAGATGFTAADHRQSAGCTGTKEFSYLSSGSHLFFQRIRSASVFS